VRIRRFLIFFKGYMSLSALVVAALPVPVTVLQLIPTYSAHRNLLSVYTSLFCFLLVAFVFYLRHSLAPLYFSKISDAEGHRRSRTMIIVPFFFIVFSVTLLFAYQRVLEISATSQSRQVGITLATLAMDECTSELSQLEAEGMKLTPEQKVDLCARIEERFLNQMPSARTMEAQLKGATLSEIPLGWVLIALYLGFFLSAEAAFVLMALREYLQELLGLYDVSLITGQTGTRPAA
jgi:hypothetical protein